MIDCDELIEDLQAQGCTQIHLAVIAEVTPVDAMHLDLAQLSFDRARIAEGLCADAPPD